MLSGSLRVTFNVSFNAAFDLLVLSDQKLEKDSWCRISGHPSVARKVTSATVEPLLPGAKTLRVVSDFGYLVYSGPVEVSSGRTTEVEVTLAQADYEPSFHFEGTVVDLGGKPVRGARVSLRESPGPGGGGPSPVPIASHAASVGGVEISEPSGEGMDPYSPEALERALTPHERSSAEAYFGYTIYSDGSADRTFITAENGTFGFTLKASDSRTVTVQYGDVSKEFLLRAGQPERCELPVASSPRPGSKETYQRVMKSVLLKDQGAYAVSRQTLLALKEKPGAVSAVDGKPIEGRVQKLLEALDRAYAEPFDFHQPDLARREMRIIAAQALAGRITSFLDSQTPEPDARPEKR
jgi:hypothetical protein